MNRPDLPSTASYIAWFAAHTPHSTAVVQDGTAATYATLAADLARAAQALEAVGVRSGQLIGIEPRPERYLNLVLMLAVEVLGAAVLLTTRDDLSDGTSLARRCALLLLAAPPSLSIEPPWRLIPPDWLSALAAAEDGPPDLAILSRPVDPDQVTGIVTTSGTTGRPKRMTMTMARQQRLIDRHLARMTQDILPNPRSLCLYRLSIRAVFLRILGVLQHGGTVLFTYESHAAALMAAGVVNHAMFTVGDMERIIGGASKPPPGHRLHVELFGAGVGRRLRDLIRARLTGRVSTRYSANETGLIADTDDNDVGTLAEGVRVRIVDEAGNDQPFGELGLILVRTETMVDGYIDDPALTAAAFRDGWYRTQDIGYLPEPGKLIVLGRADDMLNIGGLKVPAPALEEEIRQIVGIRDAVVLSIDSPNGVGRLIAAIEIAGGTDPDGPRRRVGAILGRHVRHFEVVPLPSLPRTETGKPRRHDLRALFLQREAAERSHLSGADAG